MSIRTAFASFIALPLLAGASCTLWTDDLIDAPRDDGGDGGSSTAEGGSQGSSGGSGGAPPGTCGDAPVPTATTCPDVCTGGCDDGVCRVRCTGEDACKDDDIVCPSSMDCRVLCQAKQACEKVELRCSEFGRCEVTCLGEKSCKEMEIEAREGPVELDCAGDACEKVELRCGSNRCQASCGPMAKKPKVRCGEACSCEACR